MNVNGSVSKVVADTPIWSLALRRASKLSAGEQRLVAELANLINEDRARLLGVVRQEVLSGIRDRQRFETIRLQLRAFLDVQLDADDYEAAAEASNLCRSAGVAGSPVDFLLVATAARRSWSIFTTDLDFGLYAAHYPLTLHVPRRSE